MKPMMFQNSPFWWITYLHNGRIEKRNQTSRSQWLFCYLSVCSSGKQCSGATWTGFRLLGQTPIPEISTMCWLRILQNASKTIHRSTQSWNTKISARFIAVRKFLYSSCDERWIVFGAFFKMRSQHISLILGIGDSSQQAKQGWVAPRHCLPLPKMKML